MQSRLAMMLNMKTRIVSSARTLTLRKETLRQLGRVELGHVVGGDATRLGPCHLAETQDPERGNLTQPGG
jgi:hypothetical protein